LNWPNESSPILGRSLRTKSSLWVPLVLVAVASVGIAFEGFQVIRALDQSVRESTRAQGEATAREITGFIDREQERLNAFANEKAQEIREILAIPDNWTVIEAVQESLKRLFRGTIAFSVTGADGRPLFEDFDGLVGPVCQVSMRDYAEALVRGDSGIAIPPIHPVPGAYHFDLITPWSLPDGESGLFFVSVAPDRIVELLAAAEQASGHRMLLVNVDDPTLIEVSSLGARDALRGNFRLMRDDLDDYHYARDLPRTHWRLIVIPEDGRLAASVREVLFLTGAVIAGFWLISAVLMVLVRRDERRNSSLFMKSLQSSVARQRAILQSMVDGLVTIDARGRIHNVNNAITTLFGYEPQELIGKNVAMLMPEPMHSEHENYIGNYLSTGESKILGKGREVIGRRKDGSVFPVLLTLGESIEGDEHMFVGILHDVTAYNEAQRKVVAQAVEIRRSHDELDQIGQMASRSLQSPLQRMASFGDAINTKDVTQLDTIDREQLRALADQARDASNLVRGLVDYARVGEPAAGERVDLEGLFGDIRKDLDVRLDAAGASLDLEGHGEVRCDHKQAHQLFWNLLDNALNFADPDRPPRIRVSIKPSAPGRVAVTISDNGIGIPEDDLERVFDAFYRVDPQHPRAGAGLGLSFSRKIAESAGGQLGVESNLGEGTTFTIELPSS
jgi:PAS domain S-box-containing protein